MWVAWLFAAEAVIISTANAITIVTFRRTPRLRMRKYWLIVNLAVADLFVGLIAIPVHIYLRQSIKKGLEITIYQTVDPFLGIASLCGLAAIAIERTYATYYPFKHRSIGKMPYIIGITVAWLGSLLFAFAISPFVEIYSVTMLAMEVLTGISVPLVIVICAYFLIFVKFTCRRNVVGHAIHQRNRKLSVTLAFITIISLVTWVPFMAFSVYYFLCYHNCGSEQNSDSTIQLLKLLHYGNSFVNFVVYSLRMPDFRTGMAQMFRICNFAQNTVQQNNIEMQNRCKERVEELTNDVRPSYMETRLCTDK